MTFFQAVRCFHSDGEERHTGFFVDVYSACSWAQTVYEGDTITDLLIYACEIGLGARVLLHTFKTKGVVTVACSCPSCNS